MIIQAEISLYPLRAQKISPVLEDFLNHLRAHELTIEPGAMSTHITGETDEVFSALNTAFAAVLNENQAVLIVKVSNACPTEHQ